MHKKFNPNKCPILETVDIISSKWVGAVANAGPGMLMQDWLST